MSNDSPIDGAPSNAAPFPPPVRILVVDDEPHVREIISRWLDDEGYECNIAADAEEACRLLSTDSFSIMVSDIKMPGKSGIDLLEEVKDQYPDMAVIMVTAVDDREIAIHTLQTGAYGYIVKPFGEDEVIINVANALERRRLVIESRQYESRLEEKVREQTEEIRLSREEITLRLIAAQEYRHDETGAHVRRIGLYAEAIGERIGRPKEYTEMLRLAAPMHDVGKIGVPDSILMKPGKLTGGEFEIMKTHTTIGGKILEGSRLALVNMAQAIALWHHERWDGSGYPHSLAGEDIPESGRIVAVADVYDALVHDRVYRPAMSEDEALAIMTSERGAHFEPLIFDVFLESLPELQTPLAGVQ